MRGAFVAVGLAVAALGIAELRDQPLFLPWVAPSLIGAGLFVVVAALGWSTLRNAPARGQAESQGESLELPRLDIQPKPDRRGDEYATQGPWMLGVKWGLIVVNQAGVTAEQPEGRLLEMTKSILGESWPINEALEWTSLPNNQIQPGNTVVLSIAALEPLFNDLMDGTPHRYGQWGYIAYGDRELRSQYALPFTDNFLLLVGISARAFNSSYAVLRLASDVPPENRSTDT